MKESLLMRVLFCKIHCPFFCKSSAAHIYTSGPLKLENNPHDLLVTSIPISNDSSDNLSTEAKKDVFVNRNQEEAGNIIKSCVRKIDSVTDYRKDVVGKKRVKWIDEFGEELAEIKEFESSETEDIDSVEESSRCFCAIL